MFSQLSNQARVVAGCGLEFPDEKRTDYIDFVYLSIVIGTWLQVPVVNVISRIIRRMAFLHGLMVFGFNSFVLLLTINLIAR